MTSRVKGLLKSNRTAIVTIFSIIIGFSIGIILKLNYPDELEVRAWLTLPGKLFLRSLKAFIVPVIFFGVVTASFSLQPKINAKLSLICVVFVIATHVIACVVAIFGSFLFPLIISHEAAVVPSGNSTTTVLPKTEKTIYDIFADILYNLIPKNIVKATIYQEMTKYVTVKERKTLDNGTVIEKFVTTRTTEIIDDANVLGILFFAILIGIAAGAIGKRGESFRAFMESLNTVVTVVLRWLISFAPIGFASLIIDSVMDMSDLSENLKVLGLFAIIVISFCLLYGVVILSAICVLFMRKNPFVYYVHFADPMLLAFASTSGAVCIHKSIQNCETKLRIDSKITRFCLPFYTALQSDGSAVFITMSTLFLIAYHNYTLQIGDYFVITIMTSILCLSLPSVPSSSLITIIVILNSINFSTVSIALLYATEFILDRVRTAVNVYSHCICTVITDKIFQTYFNKTICNINEENEMSVAVNEGKVLVQEDLNADKDTVQCV